MKKLLVSILVASQYLLLAACSPVKPAITEVYNLDSYSKKQLSHHNTRRSILITQPEAVTGYQTEQMLYVKKPFEIAPFAHSAWVGSPADMLFPLIVQSVQHSGYFYAVSSSPNSELTDYRLDTQIIKLQQNFLTHPSELDLVVKVVLSNVRTNQILASRMLNQAVRCPSDNPYGGVLAANQATLQFTEKLSKFIASQTM